MPSTRGLYIDENMALVDQAIEKLELRGLFYEVSDIAEEAGNYAEKRGDFESALKFFKVAYVARLNQNMGACQ
ncbi:hypothetical protein J32TS2_26510 [Shouchella clausii]|nr:hypothetical protein CHH73_18080 [Shouchella clausii]GIN08510.1 hypothetical protein J1TS1_26550 [Shouchella clausii]GIN17295.1 hypothetical protein J32TS2_26510 [Shouchella clausii]